MELFNEVHGKSYRFWNHLVAIQLELFHILLYIIFLCVFFSLDSFTAKHVVNIGSEDYLPLIRNGIILQIILIFRKCRNVSIVPVCKKRQSLLSHEMFKKAGTAEILRSHQKDDYYLTSLRSSIAETFQLLAGARKWIKWRKELDIVSDLGYFVLTTISGNQTIGEEYVNIIQVDSTLRYIPSIQRRSLMVLLHVVSPYILQKSLKSLETLLRTAPHQSADTEKLLKSIPVIQKCLLYLHRLHLGIFYLHGVFYHIAKRIMGIHFIKYMGNKSRSSDTSSLTFRYLAWLSLGQITLSALLQLYRYYQASLRSTPLNNTPYTSKRRKGLAYRNCLLCLESLQSPTLAPCGHLYCWNCIHSWCQTKSECPLCRDKFLPHRLVFLHNL